MYFTLGRSVWFCIVSVIMQLGRGSHHIGLGFRLRNGKLEIGLKHIAYVIHAKSFSAAFFLSIKKTSTGAKCILYTKNKYEDSVAFQCCPEWPGQALGTDVRHRTAQENKVHPRPKSKKGKDTNFLNSCIKNGI